jgi:hypothetical protein
VVECTALEMRHTGNRIGGSNPSLSAKSHRNFPSDQKSLRDKVFANTLWADFA